MARVIDVRAGDIDPAAEIERLAAGQPGIGAVASFIGLCRDEGGRLRALELEHYPGMAEAELDRVAAEAESRWPLLGLAIVHRHGIVPAGGRIVLVGVAAAHRGPAFAAAEFLMDYLKTRAPFWKREHLSDGTVGAWIDARAVDESAAGRWSV